MYRIIGSDGRQYGPVSADQLREWIAQRRVTLQTLVQSDDQAEWKPLANFSEFYEGAVSAAPPVIGPVSHSRATPATEGSEKKITAGILGILLGALGIHKFILGYNTEGIIMLLVSLVGGLLTLGGATFVMFIIGLVEGIIYLTKSDEEFAAIYLRQKRGWF